MKRGIISIGVWAVLALAASAGAQGVASSGPAASGPSASPAVLLEKGIYTEQTVGDLDAAIGIYQQIVRDAQANRSYVAQAQFRLGACLLKKGQKDQALAAFEAVASHFSDQKDLAAQAAKQIDALRPAGAGQARTRHFVLVVASPDGLTFQGEKTTWDGLPALLEKVPDRANTVLEAAVASADVSLQFKNDSTGKLTALARQLGFEYFSDTGIKPLGSKGDADLQIEARLRLPWQVMSYIGQSAMQSYIKAKASGTAVNFRIFGVDNQFNDLNGGLLAAANMGSEPQPGPIHLGNFGVEKPDYDLVDEQGNPQEYELRSNETESVGKWGLWWKPAQPLEPGAFRVFAYVGKKPMPLANADGKAKLEMNNHFGAPVLESFFLVVHQGMILDSSSVPPTSKKTIVGYDIYLWQEEVPANTTHQVDVVLKRPQAASTLSSADAEATKGKLIDWIGTFFNENYRDIKSAKTLEWGEPEKAAGGNLSIRYKYLATMRNDDKFVINQRFTFTPEGKYVSAEIIEKGPATQAGSKLSSADAETTKGKLIDWIGTFFNENYRDIKSAKTLEWGEPEKAPGGNLSIRYKYLATMRNDDKFVINQRFTFTPEGKYVSAEIIEKRPVTQPAAADEK